MTRKGKREEARRQREQAAPAAESTANRCEKPQKIASLTPKRLRFAILWAEADPSDSLQDVAIRAGFSETTAKSGAIAEMCRDAAIIKRRDVRLDELVKASDVTVEDALIGLRLLAADPDVPSRDRAAAYKTILAWHAPTKGMHKPEVAADKGPAKATPDEWADQFELDVLNIRLNGPDDG